MFGENKRFFSFEMKHLGFQVSASVSASLYSIAPNLYMEREWNDTVM
jgi:hypothetical protein